MCGGGGHWPAHAIHLLPQIPSLNAPPPPPRPRTDIFPAIGMAAVLARAREITDEMFVVAAEELAGMTDTRQLEQGRYAPPLPSPHSPLPNLSPTRRRMCCC